MRFFSRFATSVARGSPHAFSVTSRYASSSDNGSTSGVTSRYRPKMTVEAALYFAKFGGTMTSEGQSRTAFAIDMAECTPNARAS